MADTINIVVNEIVEDVAINVTESTESVTINVSEVSGPAGKSAEIRATATHIQGRKEGEEWENIIALSELAGEDGVTPQKGVDYFDGEDGITPQKGVDYFDGAAFTYDDFTPQQLESLKGADGKDIQIQVTGTHIQTRPVGGEWSNLIELSELKGENGVTPQKGVDYFDGEDGTTPQKNVDYFDGEDGTEIELQKTATHVQWRYVGGSWADLIALTELKGEDGSDATVTKEAVESVLTGTISSHSHEGGGLTQAQILTRQI
jgi:hypothetical protein